MQMGKSDMQLYWDGENKRMSVRTTNKADEERTKDTSMKEVMVHASCHCERVKFTVRVNVPFTAIECNCSICCKKGYLHLTVAKECVCISSESLTNLTTYTFNTDVAQHTFCSTCGVQPLYTPRSNPECYSVNVRCLSIDGVVPIVKLDGRNFTGRLNVN